MKSGIGDIGQVLEPRWLIAKILQSLNSAVISLFFTISHPPSQWDSMVGGDVGVFPSKWAKYMMYGWITVGIMDFHLSY